MSLLAACAAPLKPATPADRATPPELGACYQLTPKETAELSSAAEPVACTTKHTSQTFAIGDLPKSSGSAREAAAHGKWVYRTCQTAFEKFLGIDESLALRVQLSWAWFRPSERGWDDGARWYRCDLVGGRADSTRYAPLPTEAKGLFAAEPPQQWITCARGREVADSPKVPCSEPHNWRAVTTIKLGTPTDSYPGDRLVAVRSHDFCSDSVGAWMNYPVEYEFGYTFFHEAEWKAGNRRSVCWARTDQ
ncbi:MAG: septum formation family protein [Marmoricola sp.]